MYRLIFVSKQKISEYENTANECKKLLPNYMIPNQIIYIERLPLNANGKVDRLKLKKML